MRVVLTFLLIGGSLLPAACYSPRHVGTGEVDTVAIPLGLLPRKVRVAPNESTILVEGTPPKDVRVFLDGKLNVTRNVNVGWEAFAFSPDGRTGVALRPGRVELLTIPELSVVRKEGTPPVYSERRVHSLPSTGEFLLTASDRGRANVFLLHPQTLKPVRSGRTTLPGPLLGRAVDDTTGLLVVTGAGPQVELFDVESMATAGMIDLPGPVSGPLVVAGGVAFVSLTDGRVVPVLLAERATAAPILPARSGEVRLGLSESGRILAIAFQDRRNPAPWPTDLLVYTIASGHIAETGRAFLNLRGEIRDLEVLERTGTVLLAAGTDLLSWSW